MLHPHCLRLLLAHAVIRIPRRPHRRVPMQEHLLAREQPVHLLQGEVAGLGVEEVDDREEGEVEYCCSCYYLSFKSIGLMRERSVIPAK